ncbi:SSI family serine proteinase inhibitor [Streptomyces sp. MS06]|uniref:SSI family serine proteinase inhibitor n=1 Tax=Streptomyces sp. MS06 TaxID=3385974 RepID=UPI0039A12F4D
MPQVTSGVLRRLVILTFAALAVCAGPPSAAARAHVSAVPPVPGSDPASPSGRDGDGVPGDHLTVTVRNAGRGLDGTYELRCHPAGGTHPEAAEACRTVDRNTRWGRETFAPVPEGAVCTMQYGGPATARVTGTWAGRPVEAEFGRADGCEIARWDRFVPLLPAPDLRRPPLRPLAPARPEAS